MPSSIIRNRRTQRRKRNRHSDNGSGTITDASGRILSGQTAEPLISISHIPIFSVGLNCALGASALEPHLEVLSKKSDFEISAHPNAGCNAFGAYDKTPEQMVDQIRTFLERLINIIGGCCGTTPDHIQAIAALTEIMSQEEKIKM